MTIEDTVNLFSELENNFFHTFLMEQNSNNTSLLILARLPYQQVNKLRYLSPQQHMQTSLVRPRAFTCQIKYVDLFRLFWV